MLFDLRKKDNHIEKGDLNVLYNFTFHNGSKFPKSYIDFVETYGYGVSCESIIVYIPMGNFCDSYTIQSPIFKEAFLDVLSWGDLEELKKDILYPDGSIELLKRAEIFAKSEDGEYFFWDIESNNEKEEFDIYITDFRGIGFTKIAHNLYDFFEKITSKNKFKQILPFNEIQLSKKFRPINLSNMSK